MHINNTFHIKFIIYIALRTCTRYNIDTVKEKRKTKKEQKKSDNKTKSNFKIKYIFTDWINFTEVKVTTKH